MSTGSSWSQLSLCFLYLQRLCGAALCNSEEVQPRIPHPDPRVFGSPGPGLGQIRWVWPLGIMGHWQFHRWVENCQGLVGGGVHSMMVLHVSIKLMFVLCLQISAKRAASPWTICQLIRWPQLCTRWFSPNPNSPQLKWFSQGLVCKCVHVNKYKLFNVTVSLFYSFTWLAAGFHCFMKSPLMAGREWLCRVVSS